MTKEENNQLLFIDLCERLPYGVMCHSNEFNFDGELLFINKVYNIVALFNNNAVGKFDTCQIAEIKPYLRPLSYLTEEEEEELKQVLEIELDYLASNEEGHTVKSAASSVFEIDFYNKNQFDYRGLIPMGLALEAPDGMYKNNSL